MSKALLFLLTLLAAAVGAGSAAVAASCITVVNDARGDILVNRCNECRIAEISHKRRTGGFPLRRSYRIPENGKLRLSFMGSGRTRVLSEGSCEAEGSTTGTRTHGECGRLSRRSDGLPALTNVCTICRGFTVERTLNNGRTTRQVYTLGGRSSLPLPLNGAAQMSIVSELPCSR